MIYWKEINEHMHKKFIAYNSKKALKKIEKIPNENELKNLKSNSLYKIPLLAISINIVDFKKLKKKYNQVFINFMLSEFIYGVTRIMKEHNAKNITIQKNNISCVLESKSNEEIDNAFILACELNTFQKHISKYVNKYFDTSNHQNDYFHLNNEIIKFGIGIWFSIENYIVKSKYSNQDNLIFLGDSIDFANELAKIASRNNNDEILMNEKFKINMTNEKIKYISNIGGFKKNYEYKNFNEIIWSCNWIIKKYSNFIDDNV